MLARNLHSFIVAIMLGCLSVMTVNAADVTPGQYQQVVPEQGTKTGDKIEVLEIFWYGCPHCFDFEPYVNQWLENKPDDVGFRRMPGVFRKNWVPGAKAYYTGEALGVLDKTHPAMFHAMQVEKRKLDNEDSIADLFEEQGVSREDFKKAWNSFTVDSKVREAMQMSRQYGITGVPAVVINGKYRTSGGTAGSYPQLLKVIDHLVDKERTQ